MRSAASGAVALSEQPLDRSGRSAQLREAEDRAGTVDGVGQPLELIKLPHRPARA